MVAESTGKDGKGIIPIINEPFDDPASYDLDRTFISMVLEGEEGVIDQRTKALSDLGHPTIRISLKDKIELGGAIFNWEVAISTAAIVLGVHPFDQPDVQSTKDLTIRSMDKIDLEHPIKDKNIIKAESGNILRTALKEWSSNADPRDYISIQAYLAPDIDTTNALQGLRRTLLERTNLATSLGYGPRYLHSTGQLQKGGPRTSLFLQLLDRVTEDIDVPEEDYSFWELIRAASLGDTAATGTTWK